MCCTYTKEKLLIWIAVAVNDRSHNLTWAGHFLIWAGEIVNQNVGEVSNGCASRSLSAAFIAFVMNFTAPEKTGGEGAHMSFI